MHKVTSWIRTWLRSHPILVGIWVLFFALCLVSVVVAPTGERPNVLYGLVVLPLLAALMLFSMGRMLDRVKMIRELTNRSKAQRTSAAKYDDTDAFD